METIVEILIDYSNSMGPLVHNNKSYLLPDGSTRMELAKKVLLEEVIPSLDYGRIITVRRFHSINDGNEILTLYDGVFDRNKISAAIESIENPINTGGTPITAAVKTSIDRLAGYPNSDRKIILITDGEENGGGDYKKTAEEAIRQHGIPCNIFIVGISQDAPAEAVSKELAASTGGDYINLKSVVYDKTSLNRAINPIISKAISTSIDNFNTVTQEEIISSTHKEKPSQHRPEEVAIDDTERKHILDLLQRNSSVLNLFSKQLTTISAGIENINNSKEVDDEEAENPELNERIRICSESYLFSKLKEKFGERIIWLNGEKESGQPHDFVVNDPIDNTIEYFVECKASMYPDKVFYMTKNEWLFFLENKSKYQVFFIANALTLPQLTQIDNLFEWILKGKVIPFSGKSTKLKANRLQFTIL